MTTQRASNRDLWVVAAVFGSACLYCLYGALQNHLMIPGRYKPGSAIYAGPAAWTFFIAVVCLWLGVSVRIGLPSIRNPRARIGVEFALLFIGVAGIYGAGYLPTVTHVP
jgi:hypothetical protein